MQNDGMKTADVMERAATEVLSLSGNAGESIQRVGDELSEGIKRLAGYLREPGISDLVEDLRQYGEYLQAHPMKALVAGLLAGFLVYRLNRIAREQSQR